LVFVSGTRTKFPQLRAGLELLPREDGERKYKGFFITAFLPVSDKTAFRYVPFLDALGVSEDDFLERTLTDEEGNVRRIGKWRMDGKTILGAQLKDGEDKDGNPRQEIGWMGEAALDDEADEDYDDEEADEEYVDEEEEAPEPPRRTSRSRNSSRQPARSARSRSTDDDDLFD
jgi:hypothetical protein